MALGILAYLHITHRRKVRNSRASVFDDCLTLFSEHRIVQDDVDYPILTGQYQGNRIELKLIADHVGYRKVPSLWLQASVYADLPLHGIIDYLVRPQNVEFFSPIDTLPVVLPIPAHWPQFATFRTDQTEEQLPPASLLDPPVALFDDPAMKEILLTPRGTRLVRQVDQARRREYLVLRSASFEHDKLEPHIVTLLLETQLALIGSVISATTTIDSTAATMPPAPSDQPDVNTLLQVQHA